MTQITLQILVYQKDKEKIKFIIIHYTGMKRESLQLKD